MLFFSYILTTFTINMGPLGVAGAYLSSPEFRRTAILWFTGIFSVVDVCSDVYST